MLWLVVIWNGIIMQHVRAHSVREAKDLPDEVERKVIYGIVVRILYCYWTNYYFFSFDKTTTD